MKPDQKILSTIIDILREHVSKDVPITADTDLEADLSIDSLKSMEILAAVEDAFDVSVPINVLSEVQTVKDLATQIEKLLKEQG
ncbi:MAG: acyl carrier protein [Thermodesulfobacteria bacterium]|nr:acyl carrier protein [Thermodesulfobacteriota bacterium]